MMATLPPPAPGPSTPAVDAVQDALEHTRRALFPFHFERWLALGLLAFLDQCGRGGGFPGGSFSGRDRTQGLELDQIAAWLSAHVGLVVALTAAGLALVVALVALVLWINTRGIFMYLDAVVTGRVDVQRPWREHAAAADALFAWRFALAVVTLLVVVLFVAGAGALLLGAPRAAPSPGLILGLLVAALLLLPPALAMSLVSMALRDFVAPLQLHLRCDVARAARATWALVRARPGVFVLYVLLKIAFALLAAFVVLIGCCFTCCLALVPVFSQTLFQPLWFFERAWSVCLLRRLGHDLFASFPGLPPAGVGAPDPQGA